MILLDDLFMRAVFAAIGVAVAATPLGCFVVWRRMAYFGDATSHAAVLGVALAIGFSVSIFAGVLGIALLTAVLVWALSNRGGATDTILGVISHSALAFGLVAVSFLPGVQVDLSAYLFGDILAVSRGDLAIIWLGALVISATLLWRWSAMLTATLNPELARASGLNPEREGLLLTLMMALVVAVAIKVVGALLIGALLVIPAAAARPLARTPERMIFVALAIGVMSGAIGLFASFELDIASGPSIVCTSSIIFGLIHAYTIVSGRRNA